MIQAFQPASFSVEMSTTDLLQETVTEIPALSGVSFITKSDDGNDGVDPDL